MRSALIVSVEYSFNLSCVVSVRIYDNDNGQGVDSVFDYSISEVATGNCYKGQGGNL